MIKTRTTISNKLGLHARASAKFTKLAGSFACEVWMSKGERRIVEIETSGPDEQPAMEALLALVADKFGEGQ